MMETMGKPDKDLNEVMKHICDVMQKRIVEAYRRGLQDGKDYYDHGCEGCKYEANWNPNAGICAVCSNSYKNLYERKEDDDEIKVGDELEHTVSGYTSKAIFLEKIGNDEDEDWYKCLFWTGCGVAILSYPKRQFKRTGKHYDIDKILKELGT